VPGILDYLKERDSPSGPKPEGLTVSKHSNSFNESMSKTMDSYYALTESFVNWDTVKINTSLADLRTSVDSLRIQEMEKDSAYLSNCSKSMGIDKS
jgi:hypothetical protein